MTFHNLKLTLGSWGGVTGSNYPIQGVDSTCNPMFWECLEWVSSKTGAFNFLPLTYNGEVTKLTWRHRYQNSEIYLLETLLLVLIAESFKAIVQSVQLWRACKIFMWWGHLTWPGDLILRDLGLKFSQHMRKRCMIKFPKNGGVVRRRFLAIWRNPEGAVLNTPPFPGEGK